MLDFCKNFLKLLQVIILFTIPLIVVYWVLIQANLSSFMGIQAVLGLILDPIILTIGTFFSYSMYYEGQLVDLTAFVAVFVLFSIYLTFHFMNQFIEVAQNKLAKMQEVKKQKEEEEMRIEMQQNYIKGLQNKKVSYLALEFNKIKSNVSYLLDDDTSDELKVYIDKIINYAKNCHGRIIKELSAEDKEFYVVLFHNHEDAMNYSFYVQRNIVTVNNEMVHQGYSIAYKGVLDCADSEGDNPSASAILEKMIKVADINRIIATSIFMQKYANLGEDKKIKFYTKGMYNIKNQKYELHDIKKAL